MATKQINTPGGVTTITGNIPKEGEIFTNIGGMGDLYQMKNGKIEVINPYLALGFNPQTGKNAQGETVQTKYGANNVQQLYAILAKEKGINLKNVPVYNTAVLGDLDPSLRNITQTDGSNWDFAKVATQTGGDQSSFTNSGDRAYTDAEREAIFKGTNPPMINPQTGEVQQPAGKNYVPPVNTSATVKAATVPNGENPQGYLPGYKGVYKGKENLMANQNAVNELFKQYHGRDATAQEIQYWSQKKVGDLEDTLAKTTIFSKEDADKIRAQMMTQGLTYIPNQAELEKLGSGAGVTLPPNTGSMLFQPTNTGSGTSGTGASGTGGTGSGSGASGTGSGASGAGASGTGDPTDPAGTLADFMVNNTDINGDSSDEEILAALTKIKEGQIDPYYKQLIDQSKTDISTAINRKYEDRIRQLQSESFNLSENIKNTQKSLAGSGLTFSGEAIKQLGTLSAFAQGTPAGLTPTQLGQTGTPAGGNVVPGQTLPAPATGLPTMTAAQMGLEGSTNLANRLTAESSRSQFNRGLEDIGTSALRLLGSQGVSGLGLPANALPGATPTTGTMQYNYEKSLQDAFLTLKDSDQALTDYQQLYANPLNTPLTT